MWSVGVDCGTQSLKVVVWSAEEGVLAAASEPYGLIEGLGAGHKEQDPAVWVEALDRCMRRLRSEGVALERVAALGVSAQQHGMVALDGGHRVLRPAKLWNDTSTGEEVRLLLERAGGVGAWAAATGHFLPVGYTASKIVWLGRREPELYARMTHVLLPHDYLNLTLTGELAAEAGDASGTGYFDVRRRAWSAQALAWMDPDRDLAAALPPLLPHDAAAGRLRPALASAWGMSPDVLVSPGGGDNMMGALGTANVEEGIVTLSLGTSGTIYGFRQSPGIDPLHEVSAFCDSTGAWLPLASTLATTVATEMVREGLLGGAGLAAFNAAVEAAPPGCGGLTLLPCLEGERTPDLPDGTGVFFGVRPGTCAPGFFARAAMEGATFALRYCFEVLGRAGVVGRELRLIGGGARSAAWRQLCADVFGLPVVCPAVTEGPALGAALQAWALAAGESARDVARRHTALDPATRAAPEPERVERYAGLYRVHRQVLSALAASGAFEAHRAWLAGDHQAQEAKRPAGATQSVPLRSP